MQRLRDHKAKLRLENVENLMLIHGTKPEDTTDELNLGHAKDLAEYRNNDKNNSLYVGFIDGTFVLPSSVISEHKARRTVQLADLRFQQSVFIRDSMPKYADRKIGDMAHMPNIDEFSIDELMAAAGPTSKLLASIFAQSTAKKPEEGS